MHESSGVQSAFKQGSVFRQESVLRQECSLDKNSYLDLEKTCERSEQR